MDTPSPWTGRSLCRAIITVALPSPIGESFDSRREQGFYLIAHFCDEHKLTCMVDQVKFIAGVDNIEEGLRIEIIGTDRNGLKSSELAKHASELAELLAVTWQQERVYVAIEDSPSSRLLMYQRRTPQAPTGTAEAMAHTMQYARAQSRAPDRQVIYHSERMTEPHPPGDLRKVMEKITWQQAIKCARERAGMTRGGFAVATSNKESDIKLWEENPDILPAPENQRGLIQLFELMHYDDLVELLKKGGLIDSAY